MIAVFLLYGILQIVSYFVTVFVLNVFAVIYGAITANKKIIFLTKGGPVILTLLSYHFLYFKDFIKEKAAFNY